MDSHEPPAAKRFWGALPQVFASSFEADFEDLKFEKLFSALLR